MKVSAAHTWDCRPVEHRVMDPNLPRIFRQHLTAVGRKMIDGAPPSKKAMLQLYGTSGWLEILEDDTLPESGKGPVDELRAMRIAKAEKLKHKHRMQALSTRVEHSYSQPACDEPPSSKTVRSTPQASDEAVNDFYASTVKMDRAAIAHLELSTRGQSASSEWHSAKTYRLTASKAR